MPTTDNLFLDSSRKYLIDLSRHLLNHSSAIVFIEGPPGSGRTLLLNHIATHFSATESESVIGAPRILDNIDQLSEHELTQLGISIESLPLLMAGLPGSCEKIKAAGIFGDRQVERLTIAPFTRSDAEHFLEEYCAPLPARNRQQLINQCRLYPGELQQATYDQELARGKFPIRDRFGLITMFLFGGFLLASWIYWMPGSDPHKEATELLTPSQPIIRETPGVTTTQTPRLPPTLASPPAPDRPMGSKPPPTAIHAAADLTPGAESKTPPTLATKFSTERSASLDQHALNLDERQLLQVNPQHFTLQLMLASDLNNIAQLIERFGLADRSYRYAKKVNGELRYCLLYGNFPSYQQAGTALAELPTQLQRLGPWRRQFSAIQAEITQSASQ